MHDPQQEPKEPQPNRDEAISSPEVMPSPEELLRKAELAAQEHYDAWLRCKAEADNIRKRAQADIANAHKYAIENFSTELLAVKDSLEAALAIENASVEQLREGTHATLRQLSQALERNKVLEINPAAGAKFDPHQHQAISVVPLPPDSTQEANTVVTVLQKGYSISDRVLRPALVTVAGSR